jgi:hypothetical protein
VQGSTLENLLNFCAKNPLHRQAEKRCAERNQSQIAQSEYAALAKNFNNSFNPV